MNVLVRPRFIPCAQYIGVRAADVTLAFIVANYGWEMSFYSSGGAVSLWHLLACVLPRSTQHSTLL